ncbi:MAG: hypothetical protein MAG453_00634 [Calditrichaeota bacterium]|nr:hypothetical protein [Calditrichota bacterium]
MAGYSDVERALRDTLEAADERFAPARTSRELSNWRAMVSPDDDSIDRSRDAEIAYRNELADKELFEQLSERLADAAVQDIELRRWASLLRQEIAPHLFPSDIREALVIKEKQLEAKVRRFRPEIDGQRSTVAEVHRIMSKSDDIDARRRAWEASKTIGPEIAQDIVDLAKARNVASRAIGFPDYYRMHMELREINETRLFSALSSFATETEDPFRRMKAQLDRLLSDKFDVDAIDLEPWYCSDPYFAKVPAVFETNVDALYAERDPMDWAPGYFERIGLPLAGALPDDAISQASLYPKQEFADIDRSGDMRIVLSPAPNKESAEEILAAFGKAAYTSRIDRDLPHTLRRPAHPSLLEAVGRFFARRATDFEWLINMFALRGSQIRGLDRLILSELRMQMVITGRWKLVQVHFERGLYRDPEQNQQNRWWDLVERFQLLRRPAGRKELADWAVQPDIMLRPVTVQNSIIADWHASQLALAMIRQLALEQPVLWMDDERIGQWLEEHVFKHGALWESNELMMNATGTPSRPDEFIEQFMRVA